MSKRMKHSTAILGIFIVIGTLLRTYFIVNIPTSQMYDFDTYYQLAVNIATGQGYTLGGYPVAWQGMFYSTFIGVLFKLFGSTSVMIPKVVNVLLSEGTLVFTYFIMKRIYNKPWAVWTSVVILTLMPHQIAYCNVVGTEIITAFLMSLTIWYSLTAVKSRYKWPVLGILSGILSLTKPFFLAYPIILAVQSWLTEKNLKKVLTELLVLEVTMWLVILPWSIRNYEKFDRLIPISYNSGFNLFINNNADNTHGGWMDYREINMPEDLKKAIESEIKAHGESVKTSPNLEVIMKPYASDWMRAHPIEFIKLGIIRTHYTYFSGSWDINAWTMNELTADKMPNLSLAEYQRNMNLLRSVSDILLGALSGFGIVYVFMNIWRVLQSFFSRRRVLRPVVSIPFLNLAFLSAVYFVYEGQPRYNFITLFLLTMAFSIGFDMIREQIKNSNSDQSS